jgi:molybdopterin molybdotransferase
LKQLSGAPANKVLRFTATCISPLKKTPGRQEFQRGILSQDESGEFFVTSSGHQGSHILGSMSAANCFIILPAECSGLNIGEKALVEPFNVEIAGIPNH